MDFVVHDDENGVDVKCRTLAEVDAISERSQQWRKQRQAERQAERREKERLAREERMREKPPHPGEFLKDCGMSQIELAETLGVARKTISDLVTGKNRLSPEMAMRLSIALDYDPLLWLERQMRHDLWAVEQGRADIMRRMIDRKERCYGWRLQAS